MQLKNKIEREKFLEEYRKWELWDENRELEVKLYRYELSNGTAIIATEYPCKRCMGIKDGKYYYEKSTDVKYHLMLSNTDNYKEKGSYAINEYKYYNPTGDSLSEIIKYLTAVKPEV